MEKLALITGASSGIGEEIAKELGQRGYSLFLTGRNEMRLEELGRSLGVQTEWQCFDLSCTEDINRLADVMDARKPDVLINNAGFGLFGDLMDADRGATQSLVTVNCLALTTLMQAAMRAMRDKQEAYILNVASVAGLLPAGPHMASYYASKAYVTSLTLGARQEARERRLPVSISALCPGPVNTRFNERAGVRFALPGKDPASIARVAVEGLFKGRPLIVPGSLIGASACLSHLLPRTLYTKLISGQQRKKG
ncbi:MAG: SDR family NAD(P)-dependent oxidoreductase [Clostridia bacterium]|nr:SDR family NAD(P)-dependent oxidoreductase [Clostridia bacterium]